MKKIIRTLQPKISLINIFIIYISVLILWSWYRNFTHYSELVDDLISKPIIWFMPLIIVFFLNKIRFTLSSFKKITLKIIILSFFSGVGLSLLQIVPNMLKGNEHMHLPPHFELYLLSTVGTAVYEELFFRGFLLQQLRQFFTVHVSNIISTCLFMVIHIPILVFVNHLEGVHLLVGLYTILVTGLCYGLLFIYSKNLWSPIIAHYIVDILLLVF